MILSLPVFAQLAAACAPSVHVDTLAAVARAESGFNALAIHDNTARRSHRAATAAEAVALATALLREGRSLDLGLMQVNSANLAPLGLGVADAFDPCKSLAAGARVLRAGFRPPAPGEDPQPALHRALSRYNTGHPERGLLNGYVARVQASAEVVVPALRLRGDAAPPPPPAGQANAPATPPSPAPSWDVWAQARARRQPTPPAPRPAPPDPAPLAPAAVAPPVQLQASSRTGGGGDAR